MQNGRFQLPSYNGGEGKSSSKLWGLVNVGVNALAMVLSVVMFVLAALYLYTAIKYSGMVLSALVFVAGIIGISDVIIFKSVPVKTFYFVGLGVLLMLIFNYNYQVDTAVADTCVKAELYLRVDGIQKALKQMKTDEMMFHLYSRMDEMEQMMDMVSTDITQSNIDEVVGKQSSEKFVSEIDNFIRLKLVHLHKHAEEVLEGLDKRFADIRDVKKSVADEQKQGQQFDEKDLRELQRIEEEIKERIETVENALRTIEKKKNNADLDIEDYQALLETLDKQAEGSHEGIKQAKKDLDVVDKTLDKKQEILATQILKQQENPISFEDWQVGMQERSKKQEEFWKLFQEHVDAQKYHEEIVDHLPEYCVQEYGVEPYIWGLCWSIVACLCVGMYTMFTAAFMQKFMDNVKSTSSTPLIDPSNLSQIRI